MDALRATIQSRMQRKSEAGTFALQRHLAAVQRHTMVKTCQCSKARIPRSAARQRIISKARRLHHWIPRSK